MKVLLSISLVVTSSSAVSGLVLTNRGTTTQVGSQTDDQNINQALFLSSEQEAHSRNCSIKCVISDVFGKVLETGCSGADQFVVLAAAKTRAVVANYGNFGVLEVFDG